MAATVQAGWGKEEAEETAREKAVDRMVAAEQKGVVTVGGEWMGRLEVT